MDWFIEDSNIDETVEDLTIRALTMQSKKVDKKPLKLQVRIENFYKNSIIMEFFIS